jgi:hypothetical protein
MHSPPALRSVVDPHRASERLGTNVNLRILVTTLAIAGPVLAGATGTPATAQPQAPAALAAPKEMRAFLVRDGRETQLPLFSADSASAAVAKVDDEAITLQTLMTSLAQAHEGRHEGAAKQHDFKPILDHLIDIKLCVLEAREMALDELPDVKKSIEQEASSELIHRVRELAIKDAKASPADVDRFYKDAVREWKLRSLLFDKEIDAQTFLKAVRGGKSFETLGKKAIADKKAKGTLEPGFAGAAGMLPQVAQFVAKAKPGAVEVVKVVEGWSVIQVLGARYPDDPGARKSAEARALEAAHERAANRYYDDLAKKYARVDWKLFDAVDFEAPKPGFEALKKDQRPLARIEGEQPFTVGDLAEGLQMKFFHGLDAPIKEHRLNAAKHDVFKTLFRKRLVLKEAARLNIAQSEDYRRHMAEFRDATLFTSYVERAIMPDVKVTEKEGQDYYAKHKAEFTSPAVYKLESLTFANSADAQAALAKLRSGTDFKWLRTNATGQVKEDARAAQLDGVTLSAVALPTRLRDQLKGAKPGDYRLDEIEGQHYVVRVVSASEQQEQPYLGARGMIAKKLMGENLQRALQETTAKLRQHHQVAVYLAKIGY